MMSIHLDALTISFVAVVISWFAFAIVFLTRDNPPKSPDRKRDSRSVKGIVLQGLSYAIVWGVHRPYFTPIIQSSKSVAVMLSIVAVILSFGSVAFTMLAVKALGKEWSLTARVVEGHKLATRGPYSFVRHPIYTGMLGMLLATGLVTSYWPALVIALVVFFIGTIIRVRIEEGLLRETFGSEFDEYASRVSAIVPGIY